MRLSGRTEHKSLWGRVLNALNLKDSQAKTLQNLILLGLVGIVLLAYSGWLTPTAPDQSPTVAVQAPTTPPASGNLDLVNYEEAIARGLEAILAQVEGAGRVEVTVSLESGPKKEVAVNAEKSTRTIEEKDSNGGTRVTTEINEKGQMVLSRSGSSASESPVVLWEERPKIAGVLVVAEGAGNSVVRYELTKAVSTALGIGHNRISVMQKGR